MIILNVWSEMRQAWMRFSCVKHRVLPIQKTGESGIIPMTTVCLFELMLNVPVKSYCHVGTLPPFYGTCTQN